MWLEGIARRRGAVLSGGRANLQKAAEIPDAVEFRTGGLGRITLETPEQFVRVAAPTAAERDAENARPNASAARLPRKGTREADALDGAADDSGEG